MLKDEYIYFDMKHRMFEVGDFANVRWSIWFTLVEKFKPFHHSSTRGTLVSYMSNHHVKR